MMMTENKTTESKVNIHNLTKQEKTIPFSCQMTINNSLAITLFDSQIINSDLNEFANSIEEQYFRIKKEIFETRKKTKRVGGDDMYVTFEILILLPDECIIETDITPIVNDEPWFREFLIRISNNLSGYFSLKN
jgi:hypothetical protein